MILIGRITCKFTPLGFETKMSAIKHKSRPCVNLPRWGLKLDKEYSDKREGVV